MILYLLLFFIVFAVFIATYNSPRSPLVLGLLLFLMALFVGASDMLGGYDRYIYGEVFDGIADVTKDKGNYLLNGYFEYFPGEPGWIYFNILISYVTANRYVFILIVTLVTYTLLFLSLKKYTENYPFAVILFLGLWFFFSFTYLRQVLAATITWLAIGYVRERKLWKFALVVFVASTVHKSATIFFPLYFIPIKKYDVNIVVPIMVVLFVLGLTGLPSMLFAAYGGVADVESKLATYEMEGAFRVDYVFEAVFFLYIILNNYEKFPDDKNTLVLMNMSLLFCAILLFFTRSQNGGRMSWYYMIGIIATMCYLGVHGRKNLSQLALGLCMLCFVLFFRILLLWNIFLYPYKTFFTNGHREGDFIYYHYEYDQGYDNDKFYR